MSTSPSSELTTATGPYINGRYRVVKQLGRGGMGHVLLVEDMHLDNRQLALKTILPQTRPNDFLERFRVEFTGLTKLRHPNIAAAHDFGRISTSKEHFFTSEYIQGVDFYTGTRDSTVDELLDITIQVLSGLDFIHSHGFLHNDLKPQNLLLESLAPSPVKDGRDDFQKLEAAVLGAARKVKIIDFGLLSGENVAWDRILGTPRFLSPERIQCRAADRRSDLYSFGVLLHLLFARVSPFQASDVKAILKMHLHTKPPSLARPRPDLPLAIIRLVDKLLEKVPDDRFESAAAALRFLRESLGTAEAPAAGSKPREIVAGSLFGRAVELSVIERAFAAASSLASECPAIEILGAAGVGKTRLVEEMRGRVQVGGGAFITIAGSGVEGHLVSTLDAVLSGLETSGVAGLETLRLRFASEGPSAAESKHLAALLEQLILEQAAAMPILIHFDDFHDASPTVRHFVLELLSTTSDLLKWGRSPPRLLVIVSHRPEGKNGGLELSGLVPMTLEPLPPEATPLFLERIFGQEGIPTNVTETIARVSQGNPGLILELARHIVEKGHVKHDGTLWVFPESLARVEIPDSISGVLEQKIASLDTKSLELLEWLAVTSIPLSAPFLARSSLLDEPDIPFLLERMAKKGVIHEERRPLGVGETIESLYSLAQSGTRNALAERLGKERMRFLHQRIAQTLEEEGKLPSGEEERFAEVVAHHWLEAGNNAAFLRYAPVAAATLRKGGNFALATDYHRRMIEGMPPEAMARKMQSLVRLSEMHEFLWDLGRSREDMERILALGGKLLKPTDRAALHRRIASIEIARNANGPALESLEAAWQSLAGPPDLVLGLSLDAPGAWAAWFEGRSEQALSHLEKAENALKSCAPSDPPQKALVAGAANHVANLHYQLGHLSVAAEIYEKNLDVLSGLALAQAEAATRCSYGGVLLDSGRPEEALGQLTMALKIAKDLSDQRTLCRTRERLAEYHLKYGEVRTAFRIARLGLEEAEMLKNPAARANSLRALGRIHFRAAQWSEAASLFEEALETHVAGLDRVGVPLVHTYLARYKLEVGMVSEALAHAATAREDAQRFGLSLVEGLSLLLSAQGTFLESGQIDSELLDAAERMFEVSGFRGEVCETRLVRARLLIATGDAAGAESALGLLAPLLETSGYVEQKGMARYVQALIDEAQGKQAAAVRGLLTLKKDAKDLVLPRIAELCKRALERILPQKVRR
ncbi:MAG TPA: protein kinase [Planctomycetota bacterium]|nr:protein kinase [Planctomycetota bacterium]